jgi:hypothetical protein
MSPVMLSTARRESGSGSDLTALRRGLDCHGADGVRMGVAHHSGGAPRTPSLRAARSRPGHAAHRWAYDEGGGDKLRSVSRYRSRVDDRNRPDSLGMCLEQRIAIRAAAVDRQSC